MNRAYQIILTITMLILYSWFMAMTAGCAPIESETNQSFKPEVYQEYEYYSDCMEYLMTECFS